MLLLGKKSNIYHLSIQIVYICTAVQFSHVVKQDISIANIVTLSYKNECILLNCIYFSVMYCSSIYSKSLFIFVFC